MKSSTRSCCRLSLSLQSRPGEWCSPNAIRHPCTPRSALTHPASAATGSGDFLVADRPHARSAILLGVAPRRRATGKSPLPVALLRNAGFFSSDRHPQGRHPRRRCLGVSGASLRAPPSRALPSIARASSCPRTSALHTRGSSVSWDSTSWMFTILRRRSRAWVERRANDPAVECATCVAGCDENAIATPR